VERRGQQNRQRWRRDDGKLSASGKKLTSILIERRFCVRDIIICLIGHFQSSQRKCQNPPILNLFLFNVECQGAPI
jgi:hypothetical protein